RELEIGRVDAVLYVDQEEDHVAFRDRLLDLLPHRPIQGILCPQDETARIHQPELPPVPIDDPKIPVAGHPRAVVYDRLPAPDEAVEQGRFAHVGAADDGDGGGLHAPSFSPGQRPGVSRSSTRSGSADPGPAARGSSPTSTSTKS